MAQAEVAQLAGYMGQLAALTGSLDEASGAGLAFPAREVGARTVVKAVAEAAGLTATDHVGGGRAVL